MYTNACINQTVYNIHTYNNTYTTTHVERHIYSIRYICIICTTPYMKHHRYNNTHTTLYIQHHTYNNHYITTRIQRHIGNNIYTTPYIQHHIYNNASTTTCIQHHTQQRKYIIIYTTASIQHIYHSFGGPPLIQHLYYKYTTYIQHNLNINT